MGTKTRRHPDDQPAKFELLVNPRTAKAPGLTCRPGAAIHADEMIE
jgi:hypothetical protein